MKLNFLRENKSRNVRSKLFTLLKKQQEIKKSKRSWKVGIVSFIGGPWKLISLDNLVSVLFLSLQRSNKFYCVSLKPL